MARICRFFGICADPNGTLVPYGLVPIFETNAGGGRVGEVASDAPLPSSNRTCRFPASGSRRDSRLKHAQVGPRLSTTRVPHTSHSPRCMRPWVRGYEPTATRRTWRGTTSAQSAPPANFPSLGPAEGRPKEIPLTLDNLPAGLSWMAGHYRYTSRRWPTWRTATVRSLSSNS